MDPMSNSIKILLVKVVFILLLIGSSQATPSLNLHTYPFSLNPQCAPSDLPQADAAAIGEERGRDNMMKMREQQLTMTQKLGSFLSQFFVFGQQSHTNDEEQYYSNNGIGTIADIDLTQYEDEVVLRFNWTHDEEDGGGGVGGDNFKSAAETLILDIWEYSQNEGLLMNTADVRIHRRRIRDFLKLLPKKMRDRKRWEIAIPDVQRAVLNSLPITSNQKTEFFDDYRTLGEIYLWLHKIEKMWSHLVSLENLGMTTEGNEIKGLKIGHGNEKKVIVTGGVEAREWLTISSTLYSIEKLLAEEEEALVGGKLSIIFVPVVNPDGFEYTWTTDRLWKKNRQSTGVAICSGIDINESLNFNDSQGQTTSQCSENYGGKSQYEALEARHVASLMNKTSTWNVINFESYSQSLVGEIIQHHDDDDEDVQNADELTTQIRHSTGRDYQVTIQPTSQHWNTWRVKLPDIEQQGFLAHKRHIKEVGDQAYKIFKILLTNL